MERAADDNAAGDLEGTLETAIKSNQPYLVEVMVDRDIRPVGTGTWSLPPLCRARNRISGSWRRSMARRFETLEASNQLPVMIPGLSVEQWSAISPCQL